ncbi:MAG: NYN domain-containing protein [bacterium]|nr:NYN domain-containing protein [bacterium]
MAEKVAIFIDGGNLYQRLKECGIFPGKRFNYAKLIDRLLRGRSLSTKRYYIGVVRNHDQTEQSQKMVEGQQKFLSALELQGFLIERGRIVYDHKIREKGVDVKIAIDLVIGAVEDEYDTAVIVSSDTDLIPAIKYVLNKGKKVEYVGFADRPSLGLARESSLSVLLLPDDIDGMAD